MSALTDARLRQLPEPIVAKLRSLIRRARKLMLIRGVFATLAVALCCILVIMAIDAAVTLFSDTLRWALSLTGLAITCLAAVHFIVRPLSRPLSLTRIARVIESRHPELHERISTAVELMSSDDPDSIRGSAELIEEVVNSAVIDVAEVSPEREFAPARSRRPMMIVGAIVAIIALLFAIFPHHIGVLFARAVAPFLDIGNAYADTLKVSPGDIRVAIGDPVSVEISIRNKSIRRAELRRSSLMSDIPEDGSESASAAGTRSEESVERMTLLEKHDDGTQIYRMTFPSVRESFDYRIRAGAAVSEYFSVTAVPMPQVEELTIAYDYPAYTRLPSAEAVSDNGDIRAVAHTRVAVTARLNRSVTSAKLLIGDSEQSLVEARLDGDRARWEFELEPATNEPWRIALEDADGFTNIPLSYQIVALDDQVPRIDIVAPAVQKLKLKPTEFLPIYYSVEEDFGFGKTHLLVKADQPSRDWQLVQTTPESSSTPPAESRLGEWWANARKLLAPGASDVGDGWWRGDAPLDLSALDLEGVTQLTARLMVEDNLPEEDGGPNIGYSEAIVIELDRNAKSLVEQTLDNQLKEIQEAIRESRAEVDKARQDGRNAERQLGREDQVNAEARQDLEELRSHTTKAEQTLHEIAERMQQSAFSQQAEDLKQVADEEIAAAREAADMIPLTDQKTQRVAEVREATKQLEEALKDLDKIERSLDEARDDAQLVAELSDLAEQQRQLAQEARQNSEQQPQQQQQQQQELSEWQRQQQEVQRELAEMLRDNEAALREVLEQSGEQATQLSEQALQLAEDQQAIRDLTQMATDADQQQSLRDQLVENLQREQQSIADATRELRQQQREQANESAAPTPKAEAPSDGSTQAQTQTPGQNPDPAEAASQPDGNDSPAEPKLDAALAEAARQTEQAAQQIAGEDLAAASESAQQAQSQLGEARQQAAADAKTTAPELGDAAASAPTTPAAPATPEARTAADELGALAERQQQVAEQLQAIAGGQIDEALAAMEAQLAEQAADLAQQSEALEKTVDMTKANAAKSTAQATDSLESGQDSADQASQQLGQAQQEQNQAEQQGQAAAGQPSEQAQQSLSKSDGQQQQAKQQFAQAAAALERAANSLEQQSKGLSAEEMDSPFVDSQDLSQSFEDVSNAASAPSSEQAAQQSQQAAQSLQQMAQAAMQQLGAMGNSPPTQPGDPSQPGQPSQQGQPPAGMADTGSPQLGSGERNPDADGSGVPPELAALGISIEDWAQLKGTLQSGRDTTSSSTTPAEYRDLVNRYFRVIAKEAAEQR